MREEYLGRRERRVGRVERDAQESAALRCNGVEKDGIRRSGRPITVGERRAAGEDDEGTYSPSVVASSARAPSVRAIVSA